MKLHENKELFVDLINRIKADNNIEKEYTEKDYWLTLILKEIFSDDIDFVFKGGTSLSKCHHVIKRFSEDVDIAYQAPYKELSRNQREKRFKRIESAINKTGLHIDNLTNLRRGRYFNQFHCLYNSLFDDSITDKRVVLELAVQTPSFPNKKVTVQSFIGEYLDKIGRNDLTVKYELEPFEVTTQSLERTLVDKTFAICDYYISNKVTRHSRHIYDLSKISSLITFDENLISLFKEVKEYRKQISIAVSSFGDKKLYEYLEELIAQDTYFEDYKQLTNILLYEPIPYENAIKGIVAIKNYLKKYNF